VYEASVHAALLAALLCTRQFLSRVPLLAPLDTLTLRRLAALMHPATFPKGTLLGTGTRVYLIQSGEVLVLANPNPSPNPAAQPPTAASFRLATPPTPPLHPRATSARPALSAAARGVARARSGRPHSSSSSSSSSRRPATAVAAARPSVAVPLVAAPVVVKGARAAVTDSGCVPSSLLVVPADSPSSLSLLPQCVRDASPSLTCGGGMRRRGRHAAKALFFPSSAGAAVQVALLGEGDTVGECGVLFHTRDTDHYVAASQVTALSVSRHQLLEVLARGGDSLLLALRAHAATRLQWRAQRTASLQATAAPPPRTPSSASASASTSSGTRLGSACRRPSQVCARAASISSVADRERTLTTVWGEGRGPRV
jgi:CRP-like cAMP-binding protein